MENVSSLYSEYLYINILTLNLAFQIQKDG